jgi:hypothetical protein
MSRTAIAVIFILAGLAVVALVFVLIGRLASAGSFLARRGVRVAVSVLAGLIVGLVGTVVGTGGAGNPFAPLPSFPSLATHPDVSLHGTVAYNALPTGSKEGVKRSCVKVVAASGGTPHTLFCAQQPKFMGAALVWLADGRLQATSLDQDHWRKVIDVTTGAITDAAWSKPAVVPLEAVGGPHGERVTVSTTFGILHLDLVRGSTTRTLLSVDVPRDYSMESLAWSPDGTFLVVEDSAARLLVITTGAHPTTRMLIDGGSGPAVSATTSGLLSH